MQFNVVIDQGPQQHRRPDTEDDAVDEDLGKHVGKGSVVTRRALAKEGRVSVAPSDEALQGLHAQDALQDKEEPNTADHANQIQLKRPVGEAQQKSGTGSRSVVPNCQPSLPKGDSCLSPDQLHDLLGQWGHGRGEASAVSVASGAPPKSTSEAALHVHVGQLRFCIVGSVGFVNFLEALRDGVQNEVGGRAGRAIFHVDELGDVARKFRGWALVGHAATAAHDHHVWKMGEHLIFGLVKTCQNGVTFKRQVSQQFAQRFSCLVV
mmetsp:Transcript_32891/g.70559  ORF Transcript_32891/g.70559 Transcript_32891/m.70559 type:complete len:265 (-) Transcript_32891:290-1084(-)